MQNAMIPLSKQILAIAEGLPEGAPLSAKALLHLGQRAAVDQALARLARRGQLLRIARGLYVRPVETRFGARAPSVETVVEAMGRALGETVVSHGSAAANRLGLTTQVPVRPVYLTSGPSRRLQLGRQTVELRHARPWQLIEPHSAAGEAVRALEWMGREHAGAAARALKARLQPAELAALAATRTGLPTWLAQSVSEAVRAYA
jgi:hypothetical protein